MTVLFYKALQVNIGAINHSSIIGN